MELFSLIVSLSFAGLVTFILLYQQLKRILSEKGKTFEASLTILFNGFYVWSSYVTVDWLLS